MLTSTHVGTRAEQKRTEFGGIATAEELMGNPLALPVAAQENLLLESLYTEIGGPKRGASCLDRKEIAVGLIVALTRGDSDRLSSLHWMKT